MWKSLQTKVIIGLTLVVAGCIGSFAYWTINETAHTLEQETLEKHQVILESNLSSLADSMWNVDTLLLSKVLGSMFQHGSGTDVVITDDSGTIQTIANYHDSAFSVKSELDISFDDESEFSEYLKKVFPEDQVPRNFEASEDNKVKTLVIKSSEGTHYFLISKIMFAEEEGDKQEVGTIYFRFSTEKLLNYIQSEQQTVMLSTLLLTFIIIAATVIFLKRQVISPIANVSKASEKVAGGDFVRAEGIDSEDEIGQLASNFNQMVNSIEENTQRLSKIVQWGKDIASQRTLHDLHMTIKMSVDDFAKTSSLNPELIVSHLCMHEGSKPGFYTNFDTRAYSSEAPIGSNDSLLMELVGDGGSVLGYLKIDRLNKELKESLEPVIKVLAINIISSINSVLLNQAMNRIEAQTQEIRSIMENINQGICMFGADLKLGSTFSNALSTMLNTEKGSTDIDRMLLQRTTLSVARKDEIKTVLDMSFGSDSLSFEANNHALPYEVTIENRVYETDWTPIVDSEDTVQRMMLTIRDVTELRQLEMESAKFQRDMKIINQLVSVPPLVFEKFFAKSQKYMHRSKEIANLPKPTVENLGEMKRYLHTLKGDSKILQFEELAEVIHETESAVLAVTSGQDGVAALAASDISHILEKMDHALEEYREINNHKLNRGSADSSLKNHNVIEAIKKTLNLSMDKNLEPQYQAELNDLSNQFMSNCFETFKETLEGYAEAVVSLCEEVQKPTPIVHVDVAKNFVLDPYCLEELKVCLTHLTRNTVDHGFDDKESGNLHMVVSSDDENITIVYDGHDAGLDLDRLRAKAEKIEYSWDTVEDLCDIIFVSGVSTKEKVTQLSGRGVGMDAVKKSMEALGGSIDIDFKVEPSLDLHKLPFRYILKVPVHHVSVMQHKAQSLSQAVA